MHRLSSLPIIAVAAGAAACSATVVFPGDGTGGTGGAGATGGTTTSNGGAGATGGSGGGTGGSSTGGGSGVCGDSQQQVAACILAPIFPWHPGEGFALSGTLTAVGIPSPGCFAPMTPDGSNFRVPRYGTAPEANAVWLTIDTQGSYVVGLAIPGLSDNTFEVGERITIAVENLNNQFGRVEQWITVSQDNELLAVVGNNAGGPLKIAEGTEQCYAEDDICGVGEQLMEVSHGDQSAAIDTDVSAPVGDLLVTNDHFFRSYDLGACNFSDPVNYLVGAASLP